MSKEVPAPFSVEDRGEKLKEDVDMGDEAPDGIESIAKELRTSPSERLRLKL